MAIIASLHNAISGWSRNKWTNTLPWRINIARASINFYTLDFQSSVGQVKVMTWANNTSRNRHALPSTKAEL